MEGHWQNGQRRPLGEVGIRACEPEERTFNSRPDTARKMYVNALGGLYAVCRQMPGDEPRQCYLWPGRKHELTKVEELRSK